MVRRQLGTGVVVQGSYSARLGDVELSDVRRVSDEELTAVVPGSLEPGVYGLTVDTPSGQVALDSAFTVEPAGPPCPGAPFGCVPPGECFSSVCAGDAGCSVSVNEGASCDGGSCGADGACILSSGCEDGGADCDGGTACGDAGCLCGDGGCVCGPDGGCATGEFPYGPWNVVPTQFAPDAGVLFDNCSGALDTTSGQWLIACSPNDPPMAIRTLPNGTEVAVLAATDFTVTSSAALYFVGDRPLIIVSTGDVNVQGLVYARSYRQVENYKGPGADLPECAPQWGADGGAPRGGGGGGGWVTPGGSGGTAGGGAGGAGGPAVASVPFPEPLRGGCTGGWGAGPSGGRPGYGGGALQISAAGALNVSGSVSVSGGGGNGGGGSGPAAGGGGGGSGGMLLLEGATVNLAPTASLTANGGGGGAGSTNGNGADGTDGSPTSATQAPGGAGSSQAGSGGLGASSLGAATAGGTGANGGGGGGGGGVGVIYVRAHDAGPGSCIRQATATSPTPVFVNCP